MAENPLKALRESTKKLRESGIQAKRETQHQLESGRARLKSPNVKGLLEMGRKAGRIGRAVGGKLGMAGMIHGAVSEAMRAKKERQRRKRGVTPEI